MMTLPELQPTATIANPKDGCLVVHGVTAGQRCHTKRRVIFPSLYSHARNERVATAIPGPNHASVPRVTEPVEIPKQELTRPLLIPLLGKPPHPTSCPITAQRSISSSLQPESTKNSVVSSHCAETVFRGRSVDSPQPAKRSVLFAFTTDTESVPLLPFPPSKIIPDLPPTDAGDLRLPTGASDGCGKPGGGSRPGAAEKTPQCGVNSPEVSVFSIRPLPVAPFIGLDRLASNQSTSSPKSRPLPSILRTSKSLSSSYIESIDLVSKSSSIESDIPSLASSNMSSGDSCNVSPVSTASSQVAKYQDPETSKGISFDPRVWVREFSRTQAEIEATWFTGDEMEDFKMAAMQRIIMMEKQLCTELIPTGTSRMVQRVGNSTGNSPLSPKRAMFSHKALCIDADSLLDNSVYRKRPSAGIPTLRPTTEIDVQKKRIFRCAVAEIEIRHILLVDSNDVCRALFSRGLQKVLPHATVVAASNTQESLDLVHHKESENNGRRGFDVVIVEERLKLSDMRQESGSALLRKLCEETRKSASKALLIGVSADLRTDASKLQESGADVLWPKPPPRMDPQLRDQILKTLLVKRGRTAVAETLFD